MAKSRTTISIDPVLAEKAQEQRINISAEVERAIKKKIYPEKKDLPDDALKMHCTECGKEVQHGFLCRESEKFFCEECQLNWNMEVRCRPYYEIIKDRTNGTTLVHSHVRIPGFEGQNQGDIPYVSRLGVNCQ